MKRGRPPLDDETVGPVDRAVFGAPEACPVCGGQLAPAFGQTVDDEGVRRSFIDPTSARCCDCGKLFKVKGDSK